MGHITAFIKALGFLFIGAAALIVAIYFFRPQDIVRDMITDPKQTAVEQKVRQFKDDQKECAALFVWHTTKKSNKWKSAGEEAQWLTFVAFWNTVKSGRTPCEVFKDAEVMLPDRTKKYQWSWVSGGPFYQVWYVRDREASKDLEAYKTILDKFGPLLGVEDIKAALPEPLKKYSCVSKLVRSFGEGLTDRLKLTLDTLSEHMVSAGYQKVREVPSGVEEGKPYRFYCPK